MIRASGDGVVILVRAKPHARRDGLAGVHGDRLRIAVAAPPDRGRANDALIAVLAEALGVPRSAVTLRSGLTNRDKAFFVAALGEAEARARLETALREEPHDR